MKKETREKHSLLATERITKSDTKFGLKEYGGIGKFRSKLEYAFAVYLNELDIKYEFEKHAEPVVNETDTTLHYIPDFFLPEYGIYVEIVRVMDKRLAHKLYWFEGQHKNQRLIVLDKKHLYEMFDSKFNIYDIIGKKKKKGHTQ